MKIKNLLACSFFKIFITILCCNAFAGGKPTIVSLVAPQFIEDNIPIDDYNVYYILENNSSLNNASNKSITQYCFVKDLEDEEQIKECLSKLKAINEGHVFNFLINWASETEVLKGAKFREYAGIKSGLQINQAEIFVDKFKMKQKLIQMDSSIPTAKFVNLSKNSLAEKNDEIRRLNFPIIIKPTLGAGSIGIEIVKNQNELNQFLNQFSMDSKFSEYIIEEYIEGPSYRVDGYVVDGKVELTLPGRYEQSCYQFFKEGEIQITRSDFKPINLQEFEEFTQKVTSALGLQEGPYHLEVIRNNQNNKLYFLEIAARPGGGSMMLQYFYNYRYMQAFFRSQVALKPEFIPTEHNLKRSYASIDCPSLPRSYAENQTIMELSFPSTSENNTYCPQHTIVRKPGDVISLNNTVATIGRFFFFGDEDKVLKDAEVFRENIIRRLKREGSEEKAGGTEFVEDKGGLHISKKLKQ